MGVTSAHATARSPSGADRVTRAFDGKGIAAHGGAFLTAIDLRISSGQPRRAPEPSAGPPVSPVLSRMPRYALRSNQQPWSRGATWRSSVMESSGAVPPRSEA